MNLWSKITAWFKGKFAQARYEGAQYNPQRSWIPGGLQSVRFDCDAHSRQEIARKVRYFEKNKPIVQILAGKFENFVVGANPQMTPASSDAEWNKAAKAWWDGWSQNCDLTSRQSFGTLLNLLARSWFIDGDVFILLTAGSERVEGGRTVRRPRLQIIEGHLCFTPPDLEKDKAVHDGVRMDENGRPIGYYFAVEVERGKYEFGPMVDAASVIHLFEPSRPGQLRGISFFHSVINEINDLDDLEILEMQAARENASTSVWIETEHGEEDPSSMRRTRFTQSATTNTSGTATENKSLYYHEISGGRARLLKRGDKVNQNAGMRPSVTTVDYWKLKLMFICGGVEIPYCIVFPDSMQGTVYRGALDMATSFFKSRHAVIADIQRRIWGYVMNWARMVEPTLADAPEDWRNVSILPPRAPNVDVGRNSAAMLEELKNGATNYDLIYGPLGLDWRTELKKLNEQLTFIESECPAVAKLLAAQNPQPPAESMDIPISGQKEEEIED